MVKAEIEHIEHGNIRNEPASLEAIFRGVGPNLDNVNKIYFGSLIMQHTKSLRKIPGGGGIFITTSEDGKIEFGEPGKVADIKNPTVFSTGTEHRRLREIDMFLHTAPDVPSPKDLSHLLSGKDDPQSAKCVFVTNDKFNIVVFGNKTHTLNPDGISEYDRKWNDKILKLSSEKEPVGHKINRVLMGSSRQGWFGLNPDSRLEIFNTIIQENAFIVFTGNVNSPVMERAPVVFHEKNVVPQKANSSSQLRIKTPRTS
jgi:hypothetical protein